MISSAINIGRRRGEFERATKIMRAVKAGSRDPFKAGIPEMSELATLATRVTAYYNGQVKEGRLLRGVPDERWINDINAAPLKPLDPELSWVFLPETRAVTIRHGHVYIRHEGKLLAWCEPELFAFIGTGYHVAVRFDPTEPVLGAAIFNAESGSRNRESWKNGEFLGLADYTPEAPQITACSGFQEEESDSHGKRFNSAVRSDHRSIGNFGLPAPAASEARNGRGAIIRVERAPEISAENSAPPRQRHVVKQVATCPDLSGRRGLPADRANLIPARGKPALSKVEGRPRILTTMELIESRESRKEVETT